MSIKDSEQVIKNIIKVARQMDKLEILCLNMALKQMNQRLTNWNDLSKLDQERLREGFRGIMELSYAGELL